MDIARIALTRHTCKAYDPTRKIPAAQVEQLKTLLRYSPSSINSQPWHFIIASSEIGKTRLTRATPQDTPYVANHPKIMNASHVVVLCARTALDDAHVAALLAQEESDGRFSTPEGKEMQNKSRAFYVGEHRKDPRELQAWTQKQVYIALGALLFGAAALGIDATPIEGFDPQRLDDELGLAEKGLKSVVLAALGYRGTDDFNAKLPKSRLPAEQIISEL